MAQGTLFNEAFDSVAALALPSDWRANYSFTVATATAVIGDVYSSPNGKLFTVVASITGATTLACIGNGAPDTAGLPGTPITLSRQSGTGDLSISYTAVTGGASTAQYKSGAQSLKITSPGNVYREAYYNTADGYNGQVIVSGWVYSASLWAGVYARGTTTGTNPMLYNSFRAFIDRQNTPPRVRVHCMEANTNKLNTNLYVEPSGGNAIAANTWYWVSLTLSGGNPTAGGTGTTRAQVQVMKTTGEYLGSDATWGAVGVAAYCLDTTYQSAVDVQRSGRAGVFCFGSGDNYYDDVKLQSLVTDRFVATTGNDTTGDGWTAARAKATISGALANYVDMGLAVTYTMAAGTYSENTAGNYYLYIQSHYPSGLTFKGVFGTIVADAGVWDTQKTAYVVRVDAGNGLTFDTIDFQPSAGNAGNNANGSHIMVRVNITGNTAMAYADRVLTFKDCTFTPAAGDWGGFIDGTLGAAKIVFDHCSGAVAFVGGGLVPLNNDNQAPFTVHAATRTDADLYASTLTNAAITAGEFPHVIVKNGCVFSATSEAASTFRATAAIYTVEQTTTTEPYSTDVPNFRTVDGGNPETGTNKPVMLFTVQNSRFTCDGTNVPNAMEIGQTGQATALGVRTFLAQNSQVTPTLYGNNNGTISIQNGGLLGDSLGMGIGLDE